MAGSALVPNYRTRDRMLTRLRELRAALETEGVLHAALFGSVARGDDAPNSDVDIILDLEPSREIGLFAFAGIKEFLEAELGRGVDLGTRDSLRPERHGAILAELVPAF